MAAELFGKYQLLHKLATGGMGEVWLARQSGPAGFDRFVAVKRLLPNLAENNEFVQMFLDEARLVARLTHPNICQVYEFGSEQGMYYLSMEYMHGEPLSSLLERSLKEKKPIPTGLAAYIVAQALEGLHFAHDRKDEHGVPLGIVHRDISPSNIFVTYDGNVKLLDFGIAKAAHRLTQTVAGAIKGKFGYIAPEVYRGEPIDRRVDIFAMGVVLWEVMLRRRLYKRETEYEVMRAIVEEAPPDPRTYDPNVPAELADAALKALAKQPADRFQTGQEMRKQIALFLRTLPTEEDAESLAGVMANIYGQVWIDLRAQVLDSFKDSSDISNADVLNASKSDSGVSKVRGAKSGNFSRSVNAPPPRQQSQPSAVVPAPPPPPKASKLPLIIGASVGVLAAAGAGVFFLVSAPPPPPAVVARTEDPRPAAPAPKPAANPTAAPVPTPQAPSKGTVVVQVQPPSAKVQLDNSEPMLVPAKFTNLVPGSKHELLITSPGYEEKKIPIEVAAGDSNYNYDLMPVAKAHKPSKPVGSAKAHGDRVDTDQPLNPWGN